MDRTQLIACGSLLYLVQALAGSSKRAHPRLWIVTQGAQAVNSSPGNAELPRVAFLQAPVWGLSHVIAQEHPELRCVRLDLDYQLDAASQASRLLTDILHPEPDEDQIAYRGQQRKVRRFVCASKMGRKLLSRWRSLFGQM